MPHDKKEEPATADSQASESAAPQVAQEQDELVYGLIPDHRPRFNPGISGE